MVRGTAKTAFGVFTKFLGPTNHRGARVKATSSSGRSITVAWEYAVDAMDNHEAAARALCDAMCQALDSRGPCVRVLSPDAGAHFAVFVFPLATVAAMVGDDDLAALALSSSAEKDGE